MFPSVFPAVRFSSLCCLNFVPVLLSSSFLDVADPETPAISLERGVLPPTPLPFFYMKGFALDLLPSFSVHVLPHGRSDFLYLLLDHASSFCSVLNCHSRLAWFFFYFSRVNTTTVTFFSFLFSGSFGLPFYTFFLVSFPPAIPWPFFSVPFILLSAVP